MQIRIGTISALNLSAGKVDVKFPDRVSTVWLLDSTRTDTLSVGASVLCAFPMGNGEGVCLGRHYSQVYAPGNSLTLNTDVKISGKLEVTGNISAANFP